MSLSQLEGFCACDHSPLTATVMRSSPPSEVIPGITFVVMLGIIMRRRCHCNSSDVASFHYRKLWKGLVKRHISGVVEYLCCFYALHQPSRDCNFPTKSEPALVIGLIALKGWDASAHLPSHYAFSERRA